MDLSQSGTSLVSGGGGGDEQDAFAPAPAVPGGGKDEGEDGEAAATATTRKSSKPPKVKTGMDAVEVQVVIAVTPAGGQGAKAELDVRNVEVDRSLSDRLLCSRQYALLPRFGRGDPLYIDRKASDYALGALPASLQDTPLLAIQTAQGDKRGGSAFWLSFTVHHPCVVMVAYDRRAKSPPEWLQKLGFEEADGTIPGPKGEYEYQIHKRTLAAHTTLRLGGNNAQGAKGAKAMYLVLLSPLPNTSSDVVAPSPTQDEGAWHPDNPLDDSGDAGNTTVPKKPFDGSNEDDLGLYWDSQENGRLRIMAPPFDTLGREWSSPFNVDALSAAGQLETPSAVLGVSVKSLPGLFHRTRAVTLWPRFVVINRLHGAVDVLPLLRPTSIDGGTRKGTVAAILPSLNRSSTLAAAEGKAKGKTRGSNPAAALTKSQLVPTDCYAVLHPGECLVIYGFLPLRTLPSALSLPPRLKRARAAALQQHHLNPHKDDEKGGDNQALARALCFRTHQQDADERVAFSHGVHVEDVGETCVWFWRDAEGVKPGPLVSANVTVHASSVFLTLRDSTLSPPYRIENRSSWASLVCKQSGLSGDTLAVGPMAFKSFSWQERDHLHQLKVSVKGYEHVPAADFALDEVGPKETLVMGAKTFLGTGVATAGGSGKVRRQQQKLYVHVSTAGRTRVITFSDMQRTEWQGPRKEMALSSWTWTLLQELYNSLDVRLTLAGLTLNLLDMDPSGRRVTELVSLTLDRLEVSKEGGKDRAQLALYHVQVDDLRPHTTMPVVLQPADSGWNSPMLLRARESGGKAKGTPPTILPLIRVMMEPELHTPWSEVVHFRGLELGVQELEVRLDLDAVMALVAYIGRLSATSSDSPSSMGDEGGGPPRSHHQHRTSSTGGGMDDKSLSLVRRLLRSKLRVPEAARGEAVGHRLVYIELFHHSSLVVELQLLAGGGAAFASSKKEKSKQAALSSSSRLEGLDPDLDEALVSGLEIIGTGLVQLLTDMARSLAQLSGFTLVFNELLLTHYYGSHYELGHIVALSLRQQALTQSYKLLGAMDLLGNPLNLFLGFGTGVVEFFRKTQAEMVGDADSKGEGLRKLAKAVIGGPFSSVSKITGTVASLLEEVVGVRDGLSEELGMSSSSSSSSFGAVAMVSEGGTGPAVGGRAAPPQHLGEGILKGGEVFYRSMKSGVKNIYEMPQQGASRDGFTGFLKGMGKGVVGALAAPLIGTLGGISRVTDTTAYFDTPKVLRRRREARVASNNMALPLLEFREVGKEEEEEGRALPALQEGEGKAGGEEDVSKEL